jgi:hypothetical protein
MAHVKIEGIVDHLSSEMVRALRETLDELVPNASRIDEKEFFRDFKRRIDRKCSTWEKVPDKYVKE